MDEWFSLLDPDYAFSENGEKIKKIAKKLYKWNVCAILIFAIFSLLAFLVLALEGGFAFVWWIPIVAIPAVVFAPHIAYWSLCFCYGFGELVSNSYKTEKNKENEKENSAEQSEFVSKLREIKPLSKTSSSGSEEASGHRWRCMNCGNMIGEDKCPICGQLQK